ncbi:MAG: hypothetical protein ACR2MS_04955 [Weeksellaceae bacterium]
MTEQNEKLNKLIEALHLTPSPYQGNPDSSYYLAKDYPLYIFEYNPKKKGDIAIHKLDGGTAKENGDLSTYRKFLQTRINQVITEATLQEAFKKLDNLIRQEINLNYLDENKIDFKIHKHNMRIHLTEDKTVYIDKDDLKSMSLDEFKDFLKNAPST